MIRFNYIENLIEKDWFEVSKSKYILYSLVAVPIILGIILPFSIIGTIVRGNTSNTHALFASISSLLSGSNGQLVGLTDLQKSIVLMSYVSDLFFLIIPLTVPIVIAADSIAGEKSRKSFEALLATPLSNSEILLGKIGLPFLFGIVGTIIGAIPYLAILYYLTNQYISFSYIININFILLVLFLTPTTGLLSSVVMVFISSRVSNTRDAQQLGTLVVLPMLVYFLVQIVLIIFSTYTIILGALFLLLIDAILIKFSINVFSRENIMTNFS